MPAAWNRYPGRGPGLDHGLYMTYGSAYAAPTSVPASTGVLLRDGGARAY
jgi:hypothetical protein